MGEMTIKVDDVTLLALKQRAQRAIGIAEALEHRLHDCMYLALAEKLACALLTADERLVRKVRGSSLSIPVLVLTDPAP